MVEEGRRRFRWSRVEWRRWRRTGQAGLGVRCGGAGAQGGDGKAYTIADGTTSVYYSGGGGGGGCVSGGQGGQGGGGNSNVGGTDK